MKFIVFVTYLLIAIIIFWKLPFTFFQQDEWAILGYYLYWDKSNLDWIDRLFRYEIRTHFIPFSNIISYLEFKVFGINFAPYAVVSIIIHATNSLLVYILFEKLYNKKSIAFIAGLIFLSSSITHQAVIWTATTIGTAGSTLFVLLSLIFIAKYLIVSHKILFLTFSFFCLFIALGFKETSLVLFLFIPLLWIIFEKKKTFKNVSFTFFPLVCLLTFYIGLRFFLFLIKNDIVLVQGLTQPSFAVLIFRAITVPLKVISQSIVPIEFITKMASIILALGHPHLNVGGAPNPFLIESVASDIVSYSISFILIVIIGIIFVYFFKYKRNLILSKLILSSLLFIVLSSLPLTFIPGKAGYLSLIDGRHLYLTNIFTSILISIMFYTVYKLVKKKSNAAYIVIVILLIYIALNSLKIRKDINLQVGNAFIRKNILMQIYQKYPTLPEKVVYYVESDKAYYGMLESDKVLPFQSGFGQTLLVWYDFHGQNYPACFFKDGYLYDLLSQGYKECEGKGFGYFRKFDLLKESIALNKVSPNNIIGLKFNSSSSSISDISEQIRSKL